jgi:diguanylate cyclase (GGDEF)-like protein
MGDTSRLQILILAGDPAAAERWAATLQGPQSRVWLAADDVPDLARLDLILTDREGSGPPGSQSAGGPPRAFLAGAGGEPGVIRIGHEGPADVRLPADVTERELRLACRLLAEIVRLRRKEDARTLVHRRLVHQALTDSLTGLPNRRAWDQAVGERLRAAAGGPGRLSLAILDLDHFKRVNDAHGHAIGDAVLRAGGRVVSGGLRSEDFVARLGGDEFGLLLWVPNETSARAVVDRVRRAIPSGLAQAGTPTVTASAGFSTTLVGDLASPLPCPALLFAAADAALREAKRQGRDRTVGGRERGGKS